MKVKTVELHFNKTEEGVQITDITRQVDHSVIASNAKDGIVIVHVSSPYLSISTMDYEEGNIQDLKNALSKLEQKDTKESSRIYDYNLGGMGTAVSFIEHGGKHLGLPKAGANDNIMHAILGPSITIPVKDNRTMLGKWQQVLLWDFGKVGDVKRVVVQIIGEFST